MYIYVSMIIYVCITTCLKQKQIKFETVILKYDFCSKILQIYISQSDKEQWAINLIRALEKGRRRDLKEFVEELVLKNKNI